MCFSVPKFTLCRVAGNNATVLLRHWLLQAGLERPHFRRAAAEVENTVTVKWQQQRATVGGITEVTFPPLPSCCRSRRWPQTRSAANSNNLPSQSMTILGKYWNVAKLERLRLRGWLAQGSAGVTRHLLTSTWASDYSLKSTNGGNTFVTLKLNSPLYWDDEFKDTGTGFVHLLQLT